MYGMRIFFLCLSPRIMSSGSSSAPAARFTRRRALVGGVGLLAAGGVGYLAYQPGNDRQLVFANLRQAMQEVERLNAAGSRPLEPATAWNWAHTLEHCAQSIEFSLHGFPQPKSTLFQKTAGAAAFSVFAWRGRMSHSLAEPIPGAAALTMADPAAALARLRQAVADFAQHPGPLHPHFAYGDLSRPQYEQAHAMHLANHLSAFDAVAQSG